MRLEPFAGIHADNGAEYERDEKYDDNVAVCREQHELNGPEIEDHDPAAEHEDEIAGQQGRVARIVEVAVLALHL